MIAGSRGGLIMVMSSRRPALFRACCVHHEPRRSAGLLDPASPRVRRPRIGTRSARGIRAVGRRSPDQHQASPRRFRHHGGHGAHLAGPLRRARIGGLARPAPVRGDRPGSARCRSRRSPRWPARLPTQTGAPVCLGGRGPELARESGGSRGVTESVLGRRRCAGGWPGMQSSLGSTGRGSFPAIRTFATKAERVLDLYHRRWHGTKLGPQEYVISSDEEDLDPGLGAACHPSLPPGAGADDAGQPRV